MATKITRGIIESYLNCKYKGHLKLTGESGAISDYETMTAAARASSRAGADQARRSVRWRGHRPGGGGDYSPPETGSTFPARCQP